MLEDLARLHPGSMAMQLFGALVPSKPIAEYSTISCGPPDLYKARQASLK